MPPVHADEGGLAGWLDAFIRLRAAVRNSVKASGVHFAGGHHELPVPDLAEARYMAVDRDVVGRIGKRRRRPLGSHQLGVRRLVAGVAAEESVPADEPQIADAADGWA